MNINLDEFKDKLFLNSASDINSFSYLRFDLPLAEVMAIQREIIFKFCFGYN